MWPMVFKGLRSAGPVANPFFAATKPFQSMNLLLTLLIVAIDPQAPIEARYPEGTDVFRCDFGEAWDQNFDGWPDGWTRRQGRGFPEYIPVKISDFAPPGAKRCLEINLDGGGAAVFAPPVNASSLYSYVLEGLIHTEGLVADRAFLSLDFLEQGRRQSESFLSEKVRDSRGWRKFRVGPVAPSSDGVRQVLVGLHVEADGEPDLKGTVRFGDLWLARLPRITLSATPRHHLFTDPEQVSIHCQASGFTSEQTSVVFQLEDGQGKVLAQADLRLATTVDPRAAAIGFGRPSPSLLALAPNPSPARGQGRQERQASPSVPLTRRSDYKSDLQAKEGAAGGASPLVGSADWKPPVPGPGFYRVSVTMPGQSAPAHRRELTLVVVEPQASQSGGEFGWSLPQGDRPLGFAELGQVVGQAGVSWIKCPVWYGAEADGAKAEELVRFCERMMLHGIHLVGLLSHPPEELRKQFRDSPASAANVFSADAKLWYPSLEPVLMRMAAQVEWWQLGDDRDLGFVDYPHLATKIGQIKAELDRVGYDVRLGFAWGWLHGLPRAAPGKQPWRFLALQAHPPLAHGELAAYLDATKDAGVARWVVLEPLSREGYSGETRIVDLVRRMMAAKMHGAETVFVPEPFSTDHGLMNDDGTPGELFLPWRTTALALGGTTFLGSIGMPEGSQNYLFGRDDRAVMVVWADRPRKEVIYLGERVEQIDLWGRRIVPAMDGSRQVIEVGTLPLFLVGVDKKIAAWEQDFALATEKIPSIFGRSQKNAFRLKNHFNQDVSGTVELVGPEAWKFSPRRTNFQLSQNQSFEQPFDLVLPLDATSGPHGVRADLEIQAERTYRFSVYRHIDIGLGDVYVELVTHLNAQGELEVEQRFVNESQKPVSFRCNLFAPHRRREKTEIIGLGYGRDVQTYRLSDGEELVGKDLWLRAEEMDGARILNYRFQARK